MNKYLLKITLKSEAIFNSGEEEQNLVNDKVLADEYGFVYFHAKTLKGQLRRRARWLGNKLAKINGEDNIPAYEESIIKLFGSEYQGGSVQSKSGDKKNEELNTRVPDYNHRGIMTLTNLELEKELRDYFRSINNDDNENDLEYKITPYDMIEAQTNRRTRIQLGEGGTCEEHMMMTYHTVKDGLVFYSEINLLDEINGKDLAVLNAIVNSLDNIGSSINRGRGKIKAVLLNDKREKVEASDLGVFFDE